MADVYAQSLSQKNSPTADARIMIVDDLGGTPEWVLGPEWSTMGAEVSTTATQAGTTDTLGAGDAGITNLYTAAGLVTVTLANIATDFECVLVSLGVGGLKVADGGMSYANGFTPKKTISQGQSLFIKQTAASTFIIIGGTAA